MAQNNIAKLSEETGAESYFLGYGTPVSLKPYFDEIGEHLSNQYLLSFAGNGGPKGKYRAGAGEDGTKGRGVLHALEYLVDTSEVDSAGKQSIEQKEGALTLTRAPFLFVRGGLVRSKGAS